jgi:hypothetical protein
MSSDHHHSDVPGGMVLTSGFSSNTRPMLITSIAIVVLGRILSVTYSCIPVCRVDVECLASHDNRPAWPAQFTRLVEQLAIPHAKNQSNF